jgi:hypothetical protein
MTNELSDAIKAAESALPDNLTWLSAFKSHPDATLELWQISGKVGVSDLMTKTDRIRLADKILKQQTSTKENTMTSTNEAADIAMFDEANRPYLLAAQKHRAKLQKFDTESIFDIALRLKQTIEKKRAADAAAQRRPDEAVFDASAHRPGFRDGTQWRHDRRKKRTTQEYDPEGRQQATYVSTSEEEDEPEKSLSDARNAYLEYVGNAYKQGKQ